MIYIKNLNLHCNLFTIYNFVIYLEIMFLLNIDSSKPFITIWLNSSIKSEVGKSKPVSLITCLSDNSSNFIPLKRKYYNITKIGKYNYLKKVLP